MASRALINVPAKAKRGDIVEIKALVSHVMETGYRHDTNGVIVPRNIITRFVCALDGEEVFAADLSPAVAANPFFSFPMRAEMSGTLTFSWTSDNGETEVRTAPFVVE